MNIRAELRRPDWNIDWKRFAIFASAVFGIAFLSRAFEIYKWDNPAFMVDGEYIMGTHDAYFWLAGAKGVGSAVGHPMAEMISFLGTVTGVQYGNIAFWLPAVFSGLTAVVAFAWGMFAGGPWVGLVAGIYSSCVPGFFFRTRLAYYDTDMVTLLFPLLVSLLLVFWLNFGGKLSWTAFRDKEAAPEFNPGIWDFMLPVVAGLISAYSEQWHSNLWAFSVAASFGAAFLALVCSPKQNRPTLMFGITLFILIIFYKPWGFFVALGALGLRFWPTARNSKYWDRLWGYIAVCVLVIIFSKNGLFFIDMVKTNVFAYLKPVASQITKTAGVLYPGITQSVIEAQNISFDILIANLTGSSALLWSGVVAYLVAIIFRPYLLLLCPFILLSFASIKMGGRFAMFGGINLGLGLSFCAVWAVNKFIKEKRTRQICAVCQAVVISMFLFGNSWTLFANTPPTPIMDSHHVRALISSGKQMPKDATVWTWWDWGYATMYYAGVNSFATGGHHDGKVLYPLALAYATPHPKQASQMIKFSAVNGGRPWDVLNKMKPEQAQRFVQSLGVADYPFKPERKQYLVASWENLRLGYWILYYGSWNLTTGVGVHPSVISINNGFSIDPKNGVADLRGQGKFEIAEFLGLDSSGGRASVYHKDAGRYLIFNKPASQAFMVDNFFRQSCLLNLLVANPESPMIKPYLKMVYEDFPFVRVFEVL